MRIKLPLFFIFFNILVSSLFSQSGDKVLAEFGNTRITQSDLKNRFELSPFISNRGDGSRDSLLSDFLYSMIAEKLWYAEASVNGCEADEEFRFYFEPVEEIILRDALFRKEIKDKVLLSASDVQQALEKGQLTVKCRIFLSQDSLLMQNLIDSVKTGRYKSADELLSIPRFTSMQNNPAELKLGTLRDEDAENTVFSLLPGQVSPAFMTESGFVVFYVTDRISSPLSLSDEKVINDIKNTVKERRVFNLTESYLINLLTPYRININEKLFTITAGEILNIISALPQAPSGDTLMRPYALTEADFRDLKSVLGKKITDAEFFRVDEKIVTVNGFLADLAFSEPLFRSGSKNQVFQKLNRLAKEYVQKQILTLEARKLNMANDPAVQKEIQEWKENLLSRFLKVSYLDSVRVSDSETEEYYRTGLSSDKDFLMINLTLVTVQTPDEVGEILKLTDSGTSFAAVAASYGKTDTLANEKGETGLKPALILGELGRTASALPLNQLYGPVKRGNGYTVFMVTERKEMSDSLKIDFALNKDIIRNHLFVKKLNRFVAGKTKAFADKYNVKVYPQNLQDIKTTGIKMFVHRLMGFGGRIAGVPLLDNWAEFIDSTELRKVLLP